MSRIGLALLLSSGLAIDARAQAIDASPMDLLQFYEMGQHDPVAQALERAATGDFVDLLKALQREGTAWIAADGPKWMTSRRQVVATFALEAARAGLETQWENSKAFIEWACTLLRRQPTASAFERAWHLAALAVLEGSRDLNAIRLHLAHIEKRVPDEARLRLARAFVLETEYWNDAQAGPVTFATPLGPPARTDRERDEGADEIVRALTPLAGVAATANEAIMRLGFFLLRAGQPDAALRRFRLLATPDDPGQAHLVHLFSAWAHQRLGRKDDAIGAYRAALDSIPAAQTASLQLAVLLHTEGRAAEAKTVMDAMLARQIPVFDPWRNFGYGDLRRWPLLISDLRRMLQ